MRVGSGVPGNGVFSQVAKAQSVLGNLHHAGLDTLGAFGHGGDERGFRGVERRRRIRRRRAARNHQPGSGAALIEDPNDEGAGDAAAVRDSWRAVPGSSGWSRSARRRPASR